jgi:hypothetical protein
MHSKMMLAALIAISLFTTGCASWWRTDTVVSYEPPRCEIIWNGEARAELIALMDSGLPSDEIFGKIAEYRRFCLAINDYIDGAQ